MFSICNSESSVYVGSSLTVAKLSKHNLTTQLKGSLLQWVFKKCRNPHSVTLGWHLGICNLESFPNLIALFFFLDERPSSIHSPSSDDSTVILPLGNHFFVVSVKWSNHPTPPPHSHIHTLILPSSGLGMSQAIQLACFIPSDQNDWFTDEHRTQEIQWMSSLGCVLEPLRRRSYNIFLLGLFTDRKKPGIVHFLCLQVERLWESVNQKMKKGLEDIIWAPGSILS